MSRATLPRVPTITVDGWPVIDPKTRTQTGHAPRQFAILEADLKHLSPEPVDSADTGKPLVPAVVPTQAAAPARFRPAVATADLNSQQRSERVDVLVTDVAVLKAQATADTRRLDYRCNAIGRDVSGLIARVNETEEALRAVATDCIRRTPPSSTFWQRLRWLVTGR